MAQAQAHRGEQKFRETPQKEMKENRTTITRTSSSSSSSFKFNAQAPEFVPKSHASPTTQMPISGYFYPCFHYLGGTGCSSDWFFVDDQEPATTFFIANPDVDVNSNCSNNVLNDDLRLKIVKQVEYQFSDMSLLANESMSRHISKDPEGFVPLSVIASTKKMKSLVTSNQLLAQALRFSSKLVVTEDGQKVKRKHPFTDKDKEDLQVIHLILSIFCYSGNPKFLIPRLFSMHMQIFFSFYKQARTVVVENLPEDHSHHNLEKIFGVVGSVKNIRICHPKESISTRPKGDFFISNKLHAFVEYESPEIAERAVEKLNDERNWRKGLRVRVLLRCSPKSVLKGRKSDFDAILDEDEPPTCESAEDSSQPHNAETFTENNGEENLMGPKEGWARGRGKARGRPQSHGKRGLLAPSPQSAGAIHCEATTKQTSKGPRMPDGTRGFTMGRGKPLAAQI
ncbi:la-related protein 6C isoform X1 [Tripterygium wilfordii]|uniref:la-related protein 6C isoform X1 n=1 Tax=Tripterygium wilfordii TaxID=458696 RepID=UPI0018F8190A|nr:la-related protein 6C isoform X1 [Tripterygium wilfordii]